MFNKLGITAAVRGELTRTRQNHRVLTHIFMKTAEPLVEKTACDKRELGQAENK